MKKQNYYQVHKNKHPKPKLKRMPPSKKMIEDAMKVFKSLSEKQKAPATVTL